MSHTHQMWLLVPMYIRGDVMTNGETRWCMRGNHQLMHIGYDQDRYKISRERVKCD